MHWSHVAPAFHHDGALRDIYILDTTLRDWAHVWEILKKDPERLTVTVDGSEVVIPSDVEGIFKIHREKSILANYYFGGWYLCCHFFCEQIIEFDLNPDDIKGAGRCRFVGELHDHSWAGDFKRSAPYRRESC